MNEKRRTKRKVVLWILIAFVLIVVGGFFLYTLNYYHADQKAFETVTYSSNVVSADGYTVFYAYPDTDRNIGLIFYPGGKVEDIAYAPLLQQLASEGITCVLVKMPFHLAVFDIKAADDIYGQFPRIETWYLMGHSLGGAMASSYVEGNEQKLAGLILLGAYPVNDSPIPTVAIYGTQDIKLDLEKLVGVDQVVIEGGNHAYFGDYGEQEGDGTAVITREEQQKQAIEAILLFMVEQKE